MINRIIKDIVIFLCVIIYTNANSQISYGGTPESFTNVGDSEYIIHSISNNIQRKQLSEFHDNKHAPLVFAKALKVNISSNTDGTWSDTDSGNRIWRVGIKSYGAYSLNLTFSKFDIPNGAKVFVYNVDKTVILGAFTNMNVAEKKVLPVMPIQGDEIIIEYNEPANAEYTGNIEIGTVGHDFIGVFGQKDGQFRQSGLCNVDVNCAEGAAVKNIKRSVCRLIINNSELGTGVLLNNTRNDSTPYILTANHCIGSDSDADNTVFVFNYESKICGGVDGSVLQSLTGAELLATTKENNSEYLDFALIKLRQKIPDKYFPLFAGWDTRNVMPIMTTAVHHPWGDVKKVSVDKERPVMNATYRGYEHMSGVFWEVLSWNTGTTQPGSSGCPLFNENMRVIGSLVGGYASCEYDAQDYFLMLSAAYKYYASPSKQLKAWLDPDNSGFTYINALDPSGGYVPEQYFDKYFDVEPNPATDYFDIYINNQSLTHSELNIYDTKGNIILSDNITNIIKRVYVSDWAPGIYIVKINGAVKKVLKI